jgi:murein DD-endopeptidase MepM/ murein hydrolase activator NlpD
MKNSIIVVFALFSYCTSSDDKPILPVAAESVSNESKPKPCADLDLLNTKVRDGTIERAEALPALRELVPKLRDYYHSAGGSDYGKQSWVFPLEGYGPSAIGGTNGSGYLASRYDYFDGNKHIGHPAHDIFIYDSDQNNIDDRSNDYVNVLSMTEGVVIATSEDWDSTSTLRGGKYIWIYTPSDSSFFYYAHNDQIFVKPCDIVQPGRPIGYVGRTGLNAYKKRSPTHLHFMQLKLGEDYYPRPVNSYKLLIMSYENGKRQ